MTLWKKLSTKPSKRPFFTTNASIIAFLKIHMFIHKCVCCMQLLTLPQNPKILTVDCCLDVLRKSPYSEQKRKENIHFLISCSALNKVLSQGWFPFQVCHVHCSCTTTGDVRFLRNSGYLSKVRPSIDVFCRPADLLQNGRKFRKTAAITATYQQTFALTDVTSAKTVTFQPCVSRLREERNPRYSKDSKWERKRFKWNFCN